MLQCCNFTEDDCWVLNVSVSMPGSSFLQPCISAALSKAEKTSIMRDKKLCHKFKLLWNSSQARSLYKTCHLPISDTFNHFQILLRGDLLLTACISYLLPPQALKYVHMRSISSWMRHWKVYEDLNLKQDFIKLEFKLI